jgi:diguanylate cyclase (GGDEF)-like protein/PAS domain S-box-containing protein
MPEAIVVERSASYYSLLSRTLESAGVPITKHFERFSDAIDDLRDRIANLRLPDLLIIGIPEKELSECEALLKVVKELPAESLPILLLSHGPLPKLDRWLSARGFAMRLLWSQFWQFPGAIDELAPKLLFSRNSAPRETGSGPVRILLIDDSVSVRKTYQQLLSAQGFAVDLGESIAEGLSKAKTGRYDLVIVDYYLPDGTGDELVTKLRADPNTKNASVALITATYKDEVIQQCLDAGAIECMFKNEVISLTLARIKALVRNIEDRRQIEADRQRLDGILRTVGDGVYGLDEKGRVTFLNHTGCRLLGYGDESEIIGLPSTEFTPEAKIDNNAARLETLFRTNEGRLLPVELSVVPQLNGGQRVGSVVVFRDISDRKNVERVRYELDHDKLTNLSNRRFFMLRLAESVVERKNGGYTAVLFLDIDRYTQVLENAGEIAAQQLLVEIGQRLQARLRENDLLARFEHDQFALKLENVQLENIYTVADGLREMLRESRYLSHAGQTLSITVSVGVAIISKDTPSAEYVIENARQACGQAKRRGQNQTQIFVVESDRGLAKELEAGWAVRIKEAMTEDRIVLLAQPIIEMASIDLKMSSEELMALPFRGGVHTTFEILIRLVNRDGQWISPGVFVPMAERFSLMPKVDLWVFARTVRFASRIPDDVPFTFAINLSNQTLLDPEAFSHIENTLASHRVPASRFVFEVAETGQISQLHTARKFMTQVRALGAKFALDDFGSGQNSIGHLKWLPIDWVKVNGESVANRSGAEVDRAMALSLTQLAHSLKLKVIAEKVDSIKALTWLKAAKVDLVQGHLLGEPKKLEDINFDELF